MYEILFECADETYLVQVALSVRRTPGQYRSGEEIDASLAYVGDISYATGEEVPEAEADIVEAAIMASAEAVIDSLGDQL